MATYKSRYAELSFYVKGELKSFSNGHYATDNEEEIAVLDGLEDAEKVEEPEVKAAVKRTAKTSKK